MKSILVPTDFSENSTNALNYAIELNKKLNGEITLFHSYYVPLIATDIPVLLPTDPEIQTAADLSLAKVKEKYQKLFPEMKFKTEISDGFPEIEIVDAEKRMQADFLIIGTRGAGAVKNIFIGSIAAIILEKSSCPTIAVPEHSKFKHLNKIVFAANYGTDDFKNVFDLIDFARPFESEIILLHVSNDENAMAFDYNQLDSFKNQIVQESGYNNISIKLFEDKNVFEGLNLYLEEVNADMFSISMRNRSFIKRVFRPSLTKKMAYHTHIPILVFHTDY